MPSGQVRYDRLLVVLVLLGLFNLGDFLATYSLVALGPHLEWNPLMRGLVGTPYFFLYKLVLIPLGLVFLWWVRRIIVPRYFGLLAFTCLVYGLVTLRTWLLFYL